MSKSTHFSGHPMHGQLIDLLDKRKVLDFTELKARLANLLLMVVQKRVRNRSCSFSGLATIIRITLMYYISFYSFLNNPDKDWKKLIEQSKEPPIQLSLFD